MGHSPLRRAVRRAEPPSKTVAGERGKGMGNVK